VDRVQRGDMGSFSRFFSLDAWFKEKIKSLSPAVQKVFPFLIVPKASKSEKNEGCDNLPEKEFGQDSLTAGIDRRNCSNENKAKLTKYKSRNNHPTCKPLKLMSYLITLGSRKNDIILDPFAGSCTTGVAAIALNRQYVMIEKEKEYYEIGKARLDYITKQGSLYLKFPAMTSWNTEPTISGRLFFSGFGFVSL
ncbi:unnamed protein product, partial [marine sediment metagenome]